MRASSSSFSSHSGVSSGIVEIVELAVFIASPSISMDGVA